MDCFFQLIQTLKISASLKKGILQEQTCSFIRYETRRRSAFITLPEGFN